MVKKKKKKQINYSELSFSITIGLICFLTVYLMCIQFKTIESVNVSEIETMREDELRASLAEWKEKYNDADEEYKLTNQKISEYKNAIEKNEESGELIEKEYENAKKLLGQTNVEGSGVTITITDNKETRVISTDLLDLVNELNGAGAEAVSINEQRIIAMSDIVDVGEFVMVNGKKISSPYTIKAIGDLTYLQSALNIKKGYIDNYKTNGYTISLSTSDKILINKYDGTLEMKYAK